MAETQAGSGGPVSPAAKEVATELLATDLAGTEVAGIRPAPAALAGEESAAAESANGESAAAELDASADDGYKLPSYKSSSWPFTAESPPTGAIHHVELWVPNLDKAIASWGWLLTALGYRMFQDWPGGRSWQAGHSYIVVEQSPSRTASRHDRCRPGLNHLAFHVDTRELVDELTREAQLHGWKLMFADQHPFAGGPQHYAAYMENSDGYEVELVAH
jgi:catechol 2,3-dioxygenase-like lactoylglutathione lyase family enzyme